MCTTEVHEVRGGGVGNAATVASGPVGVPVTAPAVPSAGGVPVTPPDGMLAPAVEPAPAAAPAAAPTAAPGLASGVVRVRPLALDSRAIAVDALGRAGAAACAVVPASRVAAVTPAASSAAVSRHSPAIVRGRPGRRGHRGAGRLPPASGSRDSPVMLAPPA